MRKTTNLNLALYDLDDNMSITGSEGLNHNMEILDEEVHNALNKEATINTDDTLTESGKAADANPALFVYDRKPYTRFKKSGIEDMVRKIMKRTTDVSSHITPHIFHHTTATTALDRGMSIVDVSRLLGHRRLDTTMEYITANLNSVKSNHQNFVI